MVRRVSFYNLFILFTVNLALTASHHINSPYAMIDLIIVVNITSTTFKGSDPCISYHSLIEPQRVSCYLNDFANMCITQILYLTGKQNISQFPHNPPSGKRYYYSFNRVYYKLPVFTLSLYQIQDLSYQIKVSSNFPLYITYYITMSSALP